VKLLFYVGIYNLVVSLKNTSIIHIFEEYCYFWRRQRRALTTLRESLFFMSVYSLPIQFGKIRTDHSIVLPTCNLPGQLLLEFTHEFTCYLMLMVADS